MTTTTHIARITGPVPYLAAGGSLLNIPLGPCLLEQVDGQAVDIVWGERGQSCATVPLKEVEDAQHNGHLTLLD